MAIDKSGPVVTEDATVPEPSFSDDEDFVDKISDNELVGDVLRQEPSIEEYEDNCVAVFGMPIVGKERVSKLSAVISKILDKIDPVHSEHFPIDEEGGSRGCCFVEFNSKTIAEYATTVLDGYKLDKNHTFSATLFSDMHKIKKPDPNWQAPKPASYNDVGDLWWWMQNSRCRDQFAIQADKNGTPHVSVFWNIKGHDPELVGAEADRPNWTETMFKWSPHGSMMATIHARGIALWGGPNFQRYQRFAHDNVSFIDFSASEKYIVTYSIVNAQWGDDDDCLRIWDVTTGEMKKGFSLYALTGSNQLPSWPFFQWSHDDKYFACLKAPEKDKLEKAKKVNGISVYETETFGLLNKRSIIVENLKNFNWCPAKNIIAYYSEDAANTPAEIGLLQMPNCEKVRSLRVYNVAEAQMFWQKNGQRLAVHTMRYNKKTTKENGETKYIGGTASHLDIFEIGGKDVSAMNLPLPEPFINFGWEPFGFKFAVLVGTAAKCTPLVYKIEPAKHQPTLISKLDAGVQLNRVAFAPAGGWLAIMAALSTGGNVLFIDTTGTEAKRTNQVEHPGFNKGYWDPTGRYFVTASTLGGRMGADLGYRIYTFQGRELVRKSCEKLSQFKWRPRPPVILSEQKHKEIRKAIKTTSVKFEREDNEEKVKASQEVIDKRRKVMAAFELVRQKNLADIKKCRDERIKLRNGVDTDAKESTADWVEEEITIALSTEKTREQVQLSAEEMRD